MKVREKCRNEEWHTRTQRQTEREERRRKKKQKLQEKELPEQIEISNKIIFYKVHTKSMI